MKWDGVRAIAHSQPGRLRLLSRNGNDVSAAYPELRALNRALGSHSAILDGEIVAFDEAGRPSFEALQPRIHLRGESAIRRRAEAAPVTYLVFDLLWLEGHGLMELPYTQRRARLDTLELEGEHWRVPASRPAAARLCCGPRASWSRGSGRQAARLALYAGPAGGSWLKIKNIQRQEAVIGGWTEGKGSRSARIGALHLGVYDGADLRYAGRVGSGFDEASSKAAVRPAGLARTRPSPAAAATRRAFRRAALGGEVEFTEWTGEGLLRHPSYKGLRDDKPADVVRDRASRGTGGRGPEPICIRQLSEHTAMSGEIDVEGRALKLTNLEKVLYPNRGFTKGQTDWLLRADRTGAPASSRRPPANAQALPKRCQGQVLLRKAVPKPSPRVG